MDKEMENFIKKKKSWSENKHHQKIIKIYIQGLQTGLKANLEFNPHPPGGEKYFLKLQ